MISKSTRIRTFDIDKNLSIVYLDMTPKIDENRLKKIEQNFQTITHHIKIFNDADTCFDYISDLTDKYILLVVFNSVHGYILKLIQDLPAIVTLYVLSSLETVKNEKCYGSIRKLGGICNNMNELLGQMKSDLEHMEYRRIEFEIVNKSDIFPSYSRNPNKQEYSFMQSQLLKTIFLKFQDDNILELVEHCRRIYSDNPFQLGLINEFEFDYNETKAIWWYTRDSFLYRTVNKALRIQDVETLYNMRTFIRHLHQQLEKLRSIHNQNQSTLTLYRGQRMSVNEFNRLKTNEGGLLSVPNFLSTSANRQIALVLAGISNDETVAIVFEITLDCDRNTTDCLVVPIEQFSQFGETEQEWLFSMGSVFRIGTIDLSEGIWYVNLTLTNDQDEILQKLTIHMSNIIQLERPNPMVPFCRLLTRMDQYNRAIDFCKRHIRSENDWEIEATLNDALAIMELEKDNDDLTLYYHQEALNIVFKHVKTDDCLLASYHSNVAISCNAVGQYKQSIEHYRIAIDLELKAPKPDYTHIAYSYDSMATTLHYQFHYYDEALDCYNRALKLMLEHLPSGHPDILCLYRNIAEAYEEINELDKALTLMHKCADAQQTSTECTPRDLVVTYRYITKIYEKQNKFEEATLFRNKYQNLEATLLPSKELRLDNMNIDAVWAKIFRTTSNS